MAVIKMSRRHTLSDEQAKTLAEEVIEDLATEFGVKYNWDDNVAKFKGAGAKGRMALSAGQVDLKLELGFLLLPFKTKIEASMTRRLDEFLSS